MNSLLLKKYFLIIVVCFLFVSQNFSQTTIENDSLSKYSFKELYNKFYQVKRDSFKAVLYAKYAIRKASYENDTIELSNGYHRLSNITKDSTHFVNFWNKIIKSTQIKPNALYPSFSYLELGDYYFHKGYKNKALELYLKMQDALSKKQNDTLKTINLIRLGILKSRIKDFKKGNKLYKKAYNQFNSSNLNKNNFKEYISLLINLSSNYKTLKLYDSAFYYNNKVKQLSIKYNNKKTLGYSIYHEGSIEFRKGNFNTAVINFKKSIPAIIDDQNYYVLSFIYKSIGYSYIELNKLENALKYYLKVDSLFNETKNYYKSQKPAYKYLLEHYKEQKNDVKHLEYINKYITVDSVLNARSRNIAKNLTDNYDIPNLIAERETIEKRLNAKLATSRKYIWLISVLSIIISLFLIYQYRRRKLYKERFKQLLEHPLPKKTTNTSTKKEHGIPDETFEKIKQQLSEFELKDQFISREVSLSYLAKEFQTNSKYLSQVINQEKEQSFNNYINQLRIQYTVEKLKFDTTFRKFSIKAIAYEVGFNTTESFSKAFFKFTGIKPSYFIKELENQ